MDTTKRDGIQCGDVEKRFPDKKKRLKRRAKQNTNNTHTHIVKTKVKDGVIRRFDECCCHERDRNCGFLNVAFIRV